MSRHSRGAQGERDWEPGQYPPPEPAGQRAGEAWERASWDSGDWADQPGSAQQWDGPSGDVRSWDEPRRGRPAAWDGQQSWDQPSWEPAPGTEHPSGPLSPLPPGGYDWREPGGEPLAPLPPRSRAADPGLAGRRHRPGPDPAVGHPSGPYPSRPYPAGYPDAAPAGYPPGPAGYPAESGGYPPGAGDYPAGTGRFPGERPVPPAAADAYQAAPARRPRGRRARGEPDGAGAEAGYPGYDGYVDQPGEIDPGAPADSGAYRAAGDWYSDADEPAWRDDGYGGGLLPGLDEGRDDQAAARDRSAPARKRRRRGRTVALVLLAVFVIFVAVVGGVGYHYYREYIHPPDFPGPGTGTVVVQIVPGDSALAVGGRLAAAGVVASSRAFENAAKANPHGNALEPGFFRVHKHMKASLALALLLSPASRVQSKVTIPEGYRLSQIIALLGRDTGNAAGYQRAVANPAGLALPAYAKGKAEGYLFPATYEVQPRTPPVQVLRAMVQQFKREAASIGLVAGAAHAQEGEGDVITVASIIEAEGKRPQDFPKIAEVIYNRLNATPPLHLQLDTTVLYGMNLVHSKAAFSVTFPSPYNTYLHAGLPPGPIDNPGRTAIEAALHPAHGNLLYFLTINSRTGETLFFPTAQQFNAAVAKYGSTGGGSGTGHG